MSNLNPYIVKIDGVREKYDPQKLRRSLKRSHVNEELRDMIVSDVESRINAGEQMTTNMIYEYAYGILKEKAKASAARYSLRRALADLGPSGFPFEHFVGEIFRKKGFKVEVGQMMQGKCAIHEVDLVAYNEEKYIVAELKFHNNHNMKSDLKVGLYVKARFDDLLSNSFGGKKSEALIAENWLITNTKFTKNLIKYIECAGMRGIGWSYPLQGSLQDLIDETGVHPLTCLTTLPKGLGKELMDRGVVLCRSLVDDRKKLSELGLKDEKIDEIVSEADYLCQINPANQ